MKISRYPASDPSALLTALREQGAVIATGLLDTTALSALNRDLDPRLSAEPKERVFMSRGVAGFYGRHTRHLTGLSGWCEPFVKHVLCHSTYQAVCDAVLLPHAATYQLNLAHVFDRGSGARHQMLHRDDDVWVHCPKAGGDVEIGSVIALVDFTRDNGATRVVPGSHRWDRKRVPLEHEIDVAEMRAGDAVIYLGSTLHGGGANVTPDWRRGLHLSYVVGWLRPEENHFLTTPPEVARRYPRAAQALIGYAVHNAEREGGGYIGSVDLQDPLELMEQGLL